MTEWRLIPKFSGVPEIWSYKGNLPPNFKFDTKTGGLYSDRRAAVPAHTNSVAKPTTKYKITITAETRNVGKTEVPLTLVTGLIPCNGLWVHKNR
eukprot:UN05813